MILTIDNVSKQLYKIRFICKCISFIPIYLQWASLIVMHCYNGVRLIKIILLKGSVWCVQVPSLSISTKTRWYREPVVWNPFWTNSWVWGSSVMRSTKTLELRKHLRNKWELYWWSLWDPGEIQQNRFYTTFWKSSRGLWWWTSECHSMNRLNKNLFNVVQVDLLWIKSGHYFNISTFCIKWFFFIDDVVKLTYVLYKKSECFYRQKNNLFFDQWE